MRIAILNNWVPFLRGGAEYLAEGLPAKLREYGHEAILVRLPYSWHPPERVVEAILACRCVRLENVDRVIGLKFPAYHVPHPNKVLWLLHQFRQAYDLWGTPSQDLPDTPEGLAIRSVVAHSDNEFLPECRKIYTNSQVTSGRLKEFNGIESEVLFPPLLDTTGLRNESYGDSVFFPSRITSAKRQFLAVEAMKYVTTPVRLIIAGGPETESELTRLQAIIERDRLGDRVHLIPRFISQEEKHDLFANSLACAYLPYDEDSYGYVTLEAFHCRKPVITCSDSGGVLILVKDGLNGFVTPPYPVALAEAMDRLYLSRRLAQQMGEAGYESMMALGINWDTVVRKLTA
jgi:glycosyltransferase involved in cell wall biosynthesis